MLATAKNFDVICLQMRNYLPRQENPIQRTTIHFIDGVKAIITNSGTIKSKIDKFIPQIFNFRTQALRWLGKQTDLDFINLFDSAYPAFESVQRNSKLALLGENIMFAMRCNMRVVKAIIGNEKLTSAHFDEQFPESALSTYEQFLGTLALSIPDEAVVQLIADWLHASLYIEFISLAGILINDEHIPVSDEVVNELAFLVADAAQDYFAIATQMGLLPARQNTISFHKDGMQTGFEEDHVLSNLGLSEFALNF